MPTVVADVVDARLQFLLLLRRPDALLGNTWQAIHAQVQAGETAVEAAERAVVAATGLTVTQVYSADFISQVYDHTRDAIVLAPVLAFAVAAGALALGEDFTDHAWCEREEARKLYLKGQLQAEGVLIAEATALFVAVGLEHFRRSGSPLPSSWAEWATPDAAAVPEA